MSVVAAEHEFAQRLGTLEGQDFQDEVCRFLRRSVSDFQHIPPKPHGDGGLDGLSHDCTVAYFCYGPEQEPSKIKARGLAREIVDKFRSDLRRVLELKFKGTGAKSKLVHDPNKELPTILPQGRKIKLVRLIVSVLDTHRIIGPVFSAFDKYKVASGCTHVEKTAAITLWSPKELVTCGIVDDATILRLQQRKLLIAVEGALASPGNVVTPSTSEFDAKFDWLEAQPGAKPGSTDTLRAHFMKHWLASIALENELANNAVALHRAVAEARQDAIVDAELEAVNGGQATQVIRLLRDRLRRRLEQHLATRIPANQLDKMADGEVARLIGECPADWRSAK